MRHLAVTRARRATAAAPLVARASSSLVATARSSLARLARARSAALAVVALVGLVACRSPAPKPADEHRAAPAARLTGDAGSATANMPAGDAGSGIAATPASDAGLVTAAMPPGDAAPAEDGTYQGRSIADVCSYLGADWLERPDRAKSQQPDRVLDALHLDRQSTVADVGAGTGYFTIRLARRVARVLATDVQPEMLRLLAANVARAGLRNVEPIRGGEHDAKLPERCCDLVLMVDVYHELSDPPAVMAGIRRALTDHGRLVLIEYRAEDPKVAIKPEHKMTLPRIRAELTALGFAFVDSLEFLPEQRIVVFTRAGTP